MARARNAITTETMDELIEKAQARVIRTKAAYDKAVDELQVLLDKRDSMRKDELWNAVIKSKKSYAEILNHIRSDTDDDED